METKWVLALGLIKILQGSWPRYFDKIIIILLKDWGVSIR